MEKRLLSYPDIKWEEGVIPKGKRIAVDTETTGLNSYKGDKAFMFSFANEQGHVTVVPRERKYHDMLKEFFADPNITKIFHNAKFDIKMIRAAGFEVNGAIADTIVMAKLADENEMSYRLKYLTGKYFDYSAKEDDAIDEWKKQNKEWKSYSEIPYPILLPYAAVDAWNCMLLFRMYATEVKHFKEMYSMDMQCLKYLIEIEDRGVLIDKKLAKEHAKTLSMENKERQASLKEATGIKLEPSNKRLLGYAIWDSGGEVLGRTEKGEPLLDKKTLPMYTESIPWMQDFIDFKKTDKVVADLKKQIIGNLDKESVLHTSFNLSQARTGRFSSSGPNLQNINKKSCIREVFIPRPGYNLFYFDYSQIEYRLYALLSGNKKLIEGYRSGDMDMHDQTAQNLNIDRDSQAKTVNFLILYGGGIKGLASLMDIPREEASNMLAKFRNANPELENLKDRLLQEWTLKGYIEDPFGKHYHIQRGDENKIVNTLIQGLACNVLKRGMLNCKELLKDHDAHMIQQIHDENIFEIREGDSGIIPLIKHAMEDMPMIDVPLVVDVEYTKTNWGAKVKYPTEEIKKWTMNQ